MGQLWNRGIFIRLNIFLLIFLFLCFYLKYNFRLSILKNNVKTLNPNLFPKIARVLYLFLCENQVEVDTYAKSLPSITADVLFICWKENCNNNTFIQTETFYVAPWLGSISKKDLPFVRLTPSINYIKVQSRVMIMNELELNLTAKTTWTTARNLLLKRALLEEHLQGWRWAYLNFGDGDIQLDCLLADKLLKTNQTNGDEIVFANHFRSLKNNINRKNQCFILIDVFLLYVSPAIGVIDGMFIPNIYNNLLTQIVYHVDAITFILPYCSRYDQRSWWTSQAILIYRSLCLYGHTIQFNGVQVIRQKHRQYPHDGDPWTIDNDMNLVPSSLIPLQIYMKQSRIISPLVLRHYHGWSLELISDECRENHTYLHPQTCKVSGEENTQTLVSQPSENTTNIFMYYFYFKCKN